jgi:hypothetical protein
MKPNTGLKADFQSNQKLNDTEGPINSDEKIKPSFLSAHHQPNNHQKVLKVEA